MTSVDQLTTLDPNNMIEWLLTPISGSAEHVIGASVAWHGRLMVLVWAFVVPAALLVARYFKIMPRQRWPTQLDNPRWFLTHRRLGNVAILIATFAVALVLFGDSSGGLSVTFHSWLGWGVLFLGWLQIIGALFRGSHGGPMDPFTRQPKPIELWPGDHFSMTRRRIVFEHTHKATGYLVVVLSVVAIFAGLREADAPRWMWLAIATWWVIVFVGALFLQRRVGCIDTYQAIWGLNGSLPGYRRKPIGIGVKRFEDSEAAKAPWQRMGSNQ